MGNDQLSIDARRAEARRQASVEVWAIWPSALDALLTMANPATDRAPADDLLAVTRPGPKSGRVARVPILGPISKRDSLWSMFFGGSSVERLTATLRQVAQDDTISTVLLDIDSPGGTVAGLPALAAEVRALRERKHVVALSNSLAASAAYWVASQADEIVATPEALTGSIGVFTVHEDWSALNQRLGVNVTYISAGKYKVEGNPDQPLSDDARAHIQGQVDEMYGLFVGDVAKGRGITAAQVRSDYGEGRVLTAKDAKAAGLIDRIATYDDTVMRLSGAKALSDDPGGSILANKRRRLEIASKI